MNATYVTAYPSLSFPIARPSRLAIHRPSERRYNIHSLPFPPLPSPFPFPFPFSIFHFFRFPILVPRNVDTKTQAQPGTPAERSKLCKYKTAHAVPRANTAIPPTGAPAADQITCSDDQQTSARSSSSSSAALPPLHPLPRHPFRLSRPPEPSHPRSQRSHPS